MGNHILNFLGKDAGFGEKNNSAYVEIENKLLLIDCGFTVFNQVKNKFDFKKYDEINIIITHLHNDHAGSLGQLILYLWFRCNIKAIILSKCEKIKEYLQISGVPDEAYILKNKAQNIQFIKTIHTKELDAYGLKLNIRNKVIIYTGDTNTLEPFKPYLKEADEFYIDVAKKAGGVHLGIDDILGELKELKKQGIDIILMHFDDVEYIRKVTNNEFYI